MDLLGFKLHLTSLDLSSHTIVTYLTLLRKFDRECGSFEETKLKEFFTSLFETLSPAGVNKYVNALRKYAEFASFKLPNFVRAYKEKPKARLLLTDDEIEALIAVEPITHKYSMLWKTIAFTGARPLEIISLKKIDIDFNSKIIYIHQTKTGKPRTLPILEPLERDLHNYVITLTHELVFPVENRPTQQMSSSAYMKDWKRRLKVCKIAKDVKPYSLRHSYLTNLCAQEADIFAIMDLAGHTNPKTTLKYYHGNIQLMRKAAQRLPLAKKNQNPSILVKQMEQLIDEYLGTDERFEQEELLEAKKHLHRAIKKEKKDK